MNRPRIRADVAGALTAAVPARLVKKLDADPTLAERWTWTGSTVTTDKGEVVTLAATDDVVERVTCSCLLSPRCLHVAAVVTLLEPAEPTIAADVRAPDPAVASESLAPDAVAAAGRATRVLADVLAAGAEAAGAFTQAELLRAIHACRAEGLHRLGAAATRVLRSIRELRADRAAFALDVLSADLREALAVATALAAGECGAALVGRARREYETIGNVRLRGVLCEAVVARSGYAGAITYLIDDRGRLFSRADVAPGGAARAAGAYEGSTNLGDAVLPHRELCRAGLFVANATASADGRLGAGQQVRAVRASEPSRWDAEPLAARFREPLGAQLARIASLDAEPESDRGAGWDLVFVAGVLAAARRTLGLALDDGTVLRLRLSIEHAELVTRDNAAVLARAAGLHVRLVGRVRLAHPGEVEALALGPLEVDAAGLELADAWHGRANLAYDRLVLPPRERPADAPSLAPVADRADLDLLAPLRRRLERVVLGGAGTLPTHALADLEREASALRERALATGASLLRDLAAVAHAARRGATGTRELLDRATFARAWLRAAVYDDAARRRLGLVAWSEGSPALGA